MIGTAISVTQPVMQHSGTERKRTSHTRPVHRASENLWAKPLVFKNRRPCLQIGPCREPRRHDRLHGHTLVELTVVMMVIGVLASFGVPRFVHSLEQSRVDMAATNLRAIWTDAFTGLPTRPMPRILAACTVIPRMARTSSPTRGGRSNPTLLCVRMASGSVTSTTFQATATRSPSTSWSGNLSIDATGMVSGSIIGPDGFTYYPTAGFQ